MSKEHQLSLRGHGGNDEDSDRPDTRHVNHGHEETYEYHEIPTKIHEDYENDEYCEIPTNILEDCENDEVCDILYTKCLRKKKPRVGFTVSKNKPRVGFTVSTDINKKILKKDTWKYKETYSKRPSVELASAGASGSGLIGMIDTFDRPADANAEGTYTRAGSYVEAFKNKPGRRLPKAGVYAEAGVGRASAEVSVFRVEARGPNASAGAEATVARLGVGAMAQAEIASASASVGPVDVKLGLGVDTGAYIGLGGVEAKILGCGFSIGRKTSISFLGSEFSFTL